MKKEIYNPKKVVTFYDDKMGSNKAQFSPIAA